MISKNSKLVYDVTDENIFEIINKGQATFYIGIDPTGDSMHIGHLSAFMFAKRLELLGNKPLIVIGGMTGMIGDPSGKSAERNLQTESMISDNANKLEVQINKIFGEKYKILNNLNWLNVPMVEFLRDYGKLFGINQMLAKDVVASRLNTGISFTEFTYQILQARDFEYLLKEHGCTLQIGGQDQWGNITAGLDLIRKTQGHETKAYGMTLPLLMKSDGGKFGKTESGAIWLDATKTSEYTFYQFLYNQADGDVINLVKRFTFIGEDELASLEESTKTEPFKRTAQKFLASTLTEFVHGQAGLEKAMATTEALFSGDVANIAIEDLKSAMESVPTENIEDNIDVQDLMVKIGAAKSRREARDFIENGAVMINGNIENNVEKIIKRSNAFNNDFHVIRRGKRKYFVGKYI